MHYNRQNANPADISCWQTTNKIKVNSLFFVSDDQCFCTLNPSMIIDHYGILVKCHSDGHTNIPTQRVNVNILTYLSCYIWRAWCKSYDSCDQGRNFQYAMCVAFTQEQWFCISHWREILICTMCMRACVCWVSYHLKFHTCKS